MEIIDNKNNLEKTVIVFGGAGYVGRYFVKYLLESNIYDRIIVVTRNLSKRMFFRDERVDVVADLSNFKVRNCKIYNFAVSAAISFKEGVKSAEQLVDSIFKYLDNNFEGDIVHISSIAVYDMGGNDYRAPSEIKKIVKNDVYSVIKAKTEQLLIQKCETKDIRYKIFRIGNVIGPGSTWVKKIIERLFENEPLIGNKNNCYYSNTTFIGNLAFFLTNYENYTNEKRIIYNFCEFGEICWKQWIEGISNSLKIKPSYWNIDSIEDINISVFNDLRYLKELIYKDVVSNVLKLPGITKYILKILGFFDAAKLKAKEKNKLHKIDIKNSKYLDLLEYKMAKIYLNNKAIGIEGIDKKILQDMPYTFEGATEVILNYIKYNT